MGKAKKKAAVKKPAAPAGAGGFVQGQRVKVLRGDYGNTPGAVVSVGGEKVAVLLDNNLTRGAVDFSPADLAAL